MGELVAGAFDGAAEQAPEDDHEWKCDCGNVRSVMKFRRSS